VGPGEEKRHRLPITIGFIIIFGGLAILFMGFSYFSWLFGLILLLLIVYIWREIPLGIVRAFLDAIFRTREI